MLSLFTNEGKMKISKVKTHNIITLDFVKQHLKVPADRINDDMYLEFQIKAATKIAEEYCGIDIVPTVVTIEDYDIKDKYYTISTPDVVLTGVSGDTQAVSATVRNYFYHSELTFDEFIDVENLRIVYTTGWTADTIPEDIVSAICVKIGELFDVDRSGYVQGTLKYTRTFENLLNPYRIII